MKLDEGVLSNSISVNGIRTHFVEAGQGAPLIFIHGAGPGAFGWGGWRQSIPVMSKHFHVYALDTLGFGYTDKPTNIDYTDEISVRHLAGFIDALCLDKVNLCGNSRGAYMAAKYLVDNPTRVNKLLMVSSGSIATAMGVEKAEERKEAKRGNVMEFQVTPETMRKFVQTVVHDHSKISDELIEERCKIASLPGADYVQKSLKKARAAIKDNPNLAQLFDLRHRLPVMTTPMKMVWGAKDNFAPAVFAQELQALLPNVEFETLPNSGHQAQNDESDKFNEIALAFFRK